MLYRKCGRPEHWKESLSTALFDEVTSPLKLESPRLCDCDIDHQLALNNSYRRRWGSWSPWCSSCPAWRPPCARSLRRAGSGPGEGGVWHPGGAALRGDSHFQHWNCWKCFQMSPSDSLVKIMSKCCLVFLSMVMFGGSLGKSLSRPTVSNLLMPCSNTVILFLLVILFAWGRDIMWCNFLCGNLYQMIWPYMW